MNERLFKRALETSFALFDEERDKTARCFVTCCAFHKGKLLHIGVNNPKTHSINNKNPLTCRRTGVVIENKGSCSELVTMKNIKYKTNIPFNKIELVNVRIDRNKNVAYSRPCLSCASLITYINPKSLYFSVKGDKFGAVFEKY